MPKTQLHQFPIEIFLSYQNFKVDNFILGYTNDGLFYKYMVQIYLNMEKLRNPVTPEAPSDTASILSLVGPLTFKTELLPFQQMQFFRL